MFFFRRWIKRLLVIALLGFVARRLLESSDPRAQRVGRFMSRFSGTGMRPARA